MFSTHAILIIQKQTFWNVCCMKSIGAIKYYAESAFLISCQGTTRQRKILIFGCNSLFWFQISFTVIVEIAMTSFSFPIPFACRFYMI